MNITEDRTTIPGHVDGVAIQWFAADESAARRLEEMYSISSALGKLFIISWWTVGKLTPAKMDEARRLIDASPVTEGRCARCGGGRIMESIRLCPRCAHESLAGRDS